MRTLSDSYHLFTVSVRLNLGKISLSICFNPAIDWSIGAQWNPKGNGTLSRVELMDIEAKKALKELGPNALMDVDLHRCK